MGFTDRGDEGDGTVYVCVRTCVHVCGKTTMERKMKEAIEERYCTYLRRGVV